MIYIAKYIRFLFQKDVCLYLCRNKLVCATKLTLFWVRFSLAEAITAAPFREKVFWSFMVAKKEPLLPPTQGHGWCVPQHLPESNYYIYIFSFLLFLFFISFWLCLVLGQWKIWGGCIEGEGKLSMLFFYLCKGPMYSGHALLCVLWYSVHKKGLGPSSSAIGKKTFCSKEAPFS